MSIFFYGLAWLALLLFAAVAAVRIVGYLKKPQHLRWELYPVAHETPDRADYGGSYLEDPGWWKKKYRGSALGALKGFLKEALFLHATWEHNRELWARTYPFHVGLYLLIAALFTTWLSALGMLAGAGDLVVVCTALSIVYDVLGFGAVLVGSSGLILRRLCDGGLRRYSMPEHFFNLGIFGLYALFGLLMCLWYGVRDFALLGNAFIYGMFTFTPMSLPPLYALYLLTGFFLLFWVPYSFLGHMFMKFFTWHDIRWGDRPNVDAPDIEAKIHENLARPVGWSAPHIRGDGKKTWADVATSAPDAEKGGTE